MVTIEEYVRFRQDGFLIVRGLIAPHEVQELLDHVDQLRAARGDLLRVHMLHEPVYPDIDESKGHGGDTHLADIHPVSGAYDPDESLNDLARIAAKYAGRERPAIVDPGHPVLFGGHVLHRSHENRSATRSRRAFVGHYCNARSHVPWDDERLEHGQMANDRHILARGSTHLPHARPRFAREAAGTTP